MTARPALALLLLAALSGCGKLPRPFEGHVGALGRRLERPPPARLAIPPLPDSSGLSPAAEAAFSVLLAKNLVAEGVPAVAAAPRKGDWRLGFAANWGDAHLVPRFTILDPAGASRGVISGPAISAAAWTGAEPGALEGEAAGVAPRVTALLRRIRLAEEESNPNSLVNRPARIVVSAVTGAPGDGDVALTRQMRLALPRLGEAVQMIRKNFDFTVKGTVHTGPAPNRQERVEIAWTVYDAAGKLQGKVVQLHDLPQGTLDHYWGDVAVVVVAQAAAAIKVVIDRAAGLPR